MPEFESFGEAVAVVVVGLADGVRQAVVAEAFGGLVGGVFEAAADGVDGAVCVFGDAVGADGDVPVVEFAVAQAVAEEASGAVEAAVDVGFVFFGVEAGAGEFVEHDVGGVRVPDFVFVGAEAVGVGEAEPFLPAGGDVAVEAGG